MDGSTKSFMCLASCVTLIFLALIYGCINSDNKVAEMVKAGADPVAAHCAMAMASNQAICTVAAMKGGVKQ